MDPGGDIKTQDFTVSSFCSSGGCVEVAQLPDGSVAIRDGGSGKAPHIYSLAEWRDFVAGVKNGEFDF